MYCLLALVPLHCYLCKEKPFWSALAIPLRHCYCYYVQYVGSYGKKDSNVMPHSVHCSFCCYVHCPWFFKKNLFIINYVLYAMLLSKRSKILFQRYVHDTMIMTNTRFHKKYINCYYIDYAVIMTKKYTFSFQHYYIHYTLMIRRKYFFPCC